MNRTSYISGLRELADALETHPDMPLPESSTFSVGFHGVGESDAKTQMRDAAKATPGMLRKDVTSSFFSLKREFGSITYELWASRETTCTPVVIGKKKVTTTEVVTPAVTREVEIEENEIEWDCGDILR